MIHITVDEYIMETPAVFYLAVYELGSVVWNASVRERRLKVKFPKIKATRYR